MANIYLNAKKDLTATTVTTLYTVPSNSRAIVKSLLISDDSNQSTTITVKLFDGDPGAGAAAFNLFTVKAISGNATEQLLTEPLIMLENEVLQLTAGHANRLYAIASILEINREDR
tara:strand:- start:30 stop:377 length:348 start_codon:yes stop_codon:yes gene_type:complete